MNDIFSTGPIAAGAAGGQNPLDFLLPEKNPDQKITFRWGEVTSITPLQVLLDGDTTPLLSSPVDLGSGLRTPGSRVYCMIYQRQLTILGPSTGGGTGSTFIGAAIGAVQVWPGIASTIPTGWLVCQGQAVSRATYASLFTVIGTQYGDGDGSTTFNVPDFRGRGPMGYSGASPFSTFAGTGGAQTHSHGSDTLVALIGRPDGAVANGAIRWLPRNVTAWSTPHEVVGATGNQDAGAISQARGAAITGNTESGSSLSPYLTVHFIIKAQMLASEVSGLDATVQTLTVTGETSGVHRAVNLGANVDLNTIGEPGAYIQKANANTNLTLNYPIAEAGLLEVFSTSSATLENMLHQRYTRYGGTTGRDIEIWHRRYYASGGGWSTWQPIIRRDSGWTNVTSFSTGYSAYSGFQPRFRVRDGVLYGDGLVAIGSGASTADNSTICAIPIPSISFPVKRHLIANANNAAASCALIGTNFARSGTAAYGPWISLSGIAEVLD